MANLDTKSRKLTPKRVRITDVADMAGVSRATASKVLLETGGKNTRVGKATAERVMRIATSLNYHPNVTAQTLAGKRTRLIGAIIDAAASPSLVKVLEQIERVVADNGYRLLVGYAHDNFEKIAEFAEDFHGRGVEGVICLAHTYPEFGHRVPGLFDRFPNRIFIHPPEVEGVVSYASVDFRAVGRVATNHLLNLGRRRIVMLGTHNRYTNTLNQMAGFVDAYEAMGLKAQPWQTWQGPKLILDRPREVKQAVDEILKLKPDAIIPANDITSLWFMGELRRRGVRIPDDIALVSAQRQPIGWAPDIRITAVDQKDLTVARKAVSRLLSDIRLPIDQPRSIQAIVLPPRLFIGDSCGGRTTPLDQKD